MKSLIVFLLLFVCQNLSFAGVDGWRMNQFTGKPDYYQTGIDSTTIEAIAVSTTALAAQTSALDISTQSLASRATALESSTSTLEGRVDGLEISTATLDSTLAAEILVRQALSTNVAVDTTTLNNDKVPYTGATGDVDLGAYKIIAASASVTELNLNGVARTTWPGGASLTDYNEWTSSNSFSSILISSGSHGLGDDLLAAGAGSRMFFYPKKSAFRAGRMINARWDDANIGIYSVSMGYDSEAHGQGAIGIGSSNNASGYESTAIGGSGHFAGGTQSIAAGGDGHHVNDSAGSAGGAIAGHANNVQSDYSVCVGGGNNSITGSQSITLSGENLIVSGMKSGAGGEWVQNAADHSFTWGRYVGLSAAADGSMLFGYDTSSVKTYTESGKFYIHGLDLRVSSSTTASTQFGLTKEGVGTFDSASFTSNTSTTTMKYVNIANTLTIPSGGVIDSASAIVSSTCASGTGTFTCTATCAAGYYASGAPYWFCPAGGAPYGTDADAVPPTAGIAYYNGTSCGGITIKQLCRRIK